MSSHEIPYIAPAQEDQRRHPDGDLPPAGRGRRDLEGGLRLRAEQPGDRAAARTNNEKVGCPNGQPTGWVALVYNIYIYMI